MSIQNNARRSKAKAELELRESIQKFGFASYENRKQIRFLEQCGFDFLKPIVSSVQPLSKYYGLSFESQCFNIYIIGDGSNDEAILDFLVQNLGASIVAHRLMYGPEGKLSYNLTLQRPNTPNFTQLINISNSVGLQNAHIVICNDLASDDIDSGTISFIYGTLSAMQPDIPICVTQDSFDEFEAQYNAGEYTVNISQTPNNSLVLTKTVDAVWKEVQKAERAYRASFDRSTNIYLSNSANFIDRTIRLVGTWFPIGNRKFYASPLEFAQTQMTVHFFQFICKSLGFYYKSHSNLDAYIPHILYLLKNFEHSRSPDLAPTDEVRYSFVPMRFDISDPATRFSLFCLCNVVSHFCGYLMYYNIDFYNKKVSISDHSKTTAPIGYRIPSFIENYAYTLGWDMSNTTSIQAPKDMTYANPTKHKSGSRSGRRFIDIPYPTSTVTPDPRWRYLPTNWPASYLLTQYENQESITQLFDAFNPIQPDVVTLNGMIMGGGRFDLDSFKDALFGVVDFNISTFRSDTNFLKGEFKPFTDMPQDNLYAMNIETRYQDTLTTYNYNNTRIVGLRLVRDIN